MSDQGSDYRDFLLWTNLLKKSQLCIFLIQNLFNASFKKLVIFFLKDFSLFPATSIHSLSVWMCEDHDRCFVIFKTLLFSYYT